MRTLQYKTDLCVVGGGMAGLCCALAAARHGVKTVLMHDRPVLGGNASSEIRMWIGGCHGQDNRESGIIEEIFLENFYQNQGLKYTLWDSVLYEKAMAEENLTVLLNTSCLDCQMDGSRIVSVKGWQSNAETFHVVEATYFADCSGDSILAPLTGANFMYGRESKSDFNETIPPDVADKKTMGMSCLFQIRETDHPVPYTPPAWAYKYESDEDLPYKDHRKKYNNNFWWIEVGGEWDCIHDSDRCREELLKICYGVWDHMKNHGDHGMENWELEWIGFLPGKRESRRYVGKYIVNQNDVESEGRFEDIIAYAGWTMDDHFPEGFYYRKGYPTIYHPAPTPWGLPYRCMLSQNIENLCFAGRNISVTHAAMSSSRVMATCAILGQALGTAVSLAGGGPLENVDVSKLQDTLMEDDCFIPWHDRKVSQLSLSAHCSSETVRNGRDRGEENLWIGKAGDTVEYSFEKDTPVHTLRLVFDNDMNRKYHNMPCNYPLVETRFKLPTTLIKGYRIEGICADGSVHSICVEDNHQRFVKHNVDWCVQKVRFVPLSTNGCEEFRLFSFEVN